jgi:UDP-glucuronate 4-epimerase
MVTGAAGFIGSHVCEFYIKQGHSIIGIDNFDNYYPEKIKQLNLSLLKKSHLFQFIRADIRDKISLNSIFSSNQVEVVIHLAAKAGVRPSIDSIEDYYDVNVNGTVTLLEAMRLNNVKKMLFASSSSVYGNNSKVPFSESDPVDNPISPYASTKKSGELLCHVYCHLYGFQISCLRFFTVFGPRQRPDLAIHKFTKLIDDGESVPFYGDGSTARDYTYIEDIVNGINCAFNNLKGYNIFNLGESRVITLDQLVKTIEETLRKKAILKKMLLQQGDVKITYADISKAKSEIGYSPRFSFKEGIVEFVKWYNMNKN